MLVFTNRRIDPSKKNHEALTRSYEPFTDVLNSVEVTSSAGGWKAANPKEHLSDASTLAQIGAVLSGTKPVLVFLHGNSTTPAACFKRCQQIEDQYGVSVIAYSWASEGCLPDGTELPGQKAPKGAAAADDDDDLAVVKTKASLKTGWIQRKAQRYGQAKTNAQHSKDSLARLLRLVASSRLGGMKQKVSLAAYSLGCHFLHYSIEEQDAEASLSVMHNVALIAGCTGAAKHSAWVGHIHPRLRVYIAYTKADSVLYAASLVDGDVKLGTDPGDDRLVGPKFRYIDFEGSKIKLGAHRYFVADPPKKLTKQAERLFTRIFNSEEDFVGGIDAMKEVYPFQCSPDGSVCYMGNG